MASLKMNSLSSAHKGVQKRCDMFVVCVTWNKTIKDLYHTLEEVGNLFYRTLTFFFSVKKSILAEGNDP
ncbi:MAG: hypothetical protein IH801_03155 [Nitrospinae bacterium]|nr:hypothetical protein [Nitrospinota bacterium]